MRMGTAGNFSNQDATIVFSFESTKSEKGKLGLCMVSFRLKYSILSNQMHNIHLKSIYITSTDSSPLATSLFWAYLLVPHHLPGLTGWQVKASPKH